MASVTPNGDTQSKDLPPDKMNKLNLNVGQDWAENDSYWNCLYTALSRISSFLHSLLTIDRLCGLVVGVLGYRSGGPCSIPGTTKKKSSGSGTGSTQPR
jgi:hypothetical protein